jgi:hypothetical protein
LFCPFRSTDSPVQKLGQITHLLDHAIRDYGTVVIVAALRLLHGSELLHVFVKNRAESCFEFRRSDLGLLEFDTKNLISVLSPNN